MYKSASESTLKTSSFIINGNDNTEFNRQCALQDAEIRDAEAQALRWLEQGHNFKLETWKVLQLDEEYNAGMLSTALKLLEKAHHLTGHGNNDLEWAFSILEPTYTEEEAMPAINIFLSSCPTESWPTGVWKIPEEIHSIDLTRHQLPHYTELAKKAVIRLARGKVFDLWDEQEEAEKAAAAEKARVDAYSAEVYAAFLEKNRKDLAAWEATPERQEYRRLMESQYLPEEPEEDDGEPDPVLERLMADARAIREAPLSAFAADAGLEDEE